MPPGYRHALSMNVEVLLLSLVRCVACCSQVWAVKSYTKSVPIYVQVLQRASLRMIAPFLDPERGRAGQCGADAAPPARPLLPLPWSLHPHRCHASSLHQSVTALPCPATLPLSNWQT